MSLSRSIVRNTLWNFLGWTLPAVVALFAIPPLIRGLGAERFGILAVGWVVMGYFALSDLGLNRATVKFVSEYFERNELLRVSGTAWNSVWAHLGLGFVWGIVFAWTAPWLVHSMFVIPPKLQREALAAFYWLAASIPLILLSGCMRGLLEAFQRFDLVNLVKIPASSINYLVPLLVLYFVDDLVTTVAVVFVGRALTFFAYTYLTVLTFPSLKWACRVKLDTLRILFEFGLPVAVSSLVMPVLLFADRFFIAGMFSFEAVTYYVTPYEIVTKLWIFSASPLSAMFPVLSAMSVNRVGELKMLAQRTFVFLLVIVTPAVGVVIALGREFLGVWVGPDFAAQSGTVAKWLALGVLANVLAQVPYTIVQCVGRPEVVARLQMVQLPIYLLFVLYFGTMFGTVGVAIAWTLRACLDAICMVVAMLWCIPVNLAKYRLGRMSAKIFPIVSFLCIAWIIDRVWRAQASVQIPVFAAFCATFVLWEWKFLLTALERKELLTYWRA